MEFSKRMILSLMDFMLNLTMVLLLIEMVMCVFSMNFIQTHATFFRVFDVYIMFIFVAELLLYYLKYENLKQYFRKHWMSILAFIFAFSVVRLLVADKILAVIEEEETMLLSGVGGSIQITEFPILLGKVVKFGGCACKKEKLRTLVAKELERHRSIYYPVLELKEIRDAAVK